MYYEYNYTYIIKYFIVGINNETYGFPKMCLENHLTIYLKYWAQMHWQEGILAIVMYKLI